MIGVIGLESMVMDDGVRAEGVIKISERPVHEITMQRPFKKRGENNASAETDRRPEYKML